MKPERATRKGRKAGHLVANRQGVALMMVIITLALLTTSVMEFLYASRVDLALAVNARDEVKAYYNAKSGINLMRLALQFQFELQDDTGFIGRAVSQSNFQLWQYLNLLLPTFVSARLDSPLGSLDLEETGAIGFGNLQGNIVFHDPIPEEGKINLNAFSGNVINQDELLQLCALLSPPQYDSLFGPTEIDDVVLPTRGEIIGSIIDYVDADSDLVVVDENCQIVPSGTGAEDRRYQDRNYQSKNEPFTTLDEVMLVAGVSHEMFQTFRDNWTVYAVANQFYVNLADAQGFLGFLCSNILRADRSVNMCREPIITAQMALLALALEGYNAFFSNPYLLLDHYLGTSTGQAEERITEGIAAGQMIGFRTERDFLTVLRWFQQDPLAATQFAMLADPNRALLFGFVATGGVAAQPTALAVSFDEAAIQQTISVATPRIYTVSATGLYGSATRTITVVIDFTQDGRLLYWREF
ncbi:MAG: general secretion pathway protein GspK [Bradymonadales bacterium]|nr:general secretion pathway protein GspK [Bradymonadales bacterium]